MAGDWIKMRASLCTHPKVLQIARIIGSSPAVARRLAVTAAMLDECVTRDVTRDVTLASLMRVWCAVNEHTDDGVLRNATLEAVDTIAGVTGFGDAMAVVGWAIFDAEAATVTLPNFLENNVPSKSAARKSGAERQRAYRERQRQKAASVTDDVTSRDTSQSHNGDGHVIVTSDARDRVRGREEEKSSATADAVTPPAGHEQQQQQPKPDADERKITFSRFCEKCAEQGEKPIPADDAIFGYIERIRLPKDYLTLAWGEFKRRYSTSGKRYTMRGWRKTFRECIEQNWYGLWAPDEGAGWKLTGKGVQVDRARRAEAQQRAESQQRAAASQEASANG